MVEYEILRAKAVKNMNWKDLNLGCASEILCGWDIIKFSLLSCSVTKDLKYIIDFVVFCYQFKSYLQTQ